MKISIHNVQYELIDKNTFFINGSNSIIDWLYNLQFKKALYSTSNIYITKGYVRLYRRYQDEFFNAFKDAEKIYGFSMGGVIAFLVAEDIYYRTGRKVEVHAYGCPKFVYNKETVKIFTERVDEKSGITNFIFDIVAKCYPFLKHPVKPNISSACKSIFSHSESKYRSHFL